MGPEIGTARTPCPLPAARYLSWGSHSSMASAAGAAHTPSVSSSEPPDAW